MAAKELVVDLSCEDSALLKEVVEKLVDGRQFFDQFQQEVYGGDKRAAALAPFEVKKEFLQSQVSGMVLNLFAGSENADRVQAFQEQIVKDINAKIAAPVVAKRGGPLQPAQVDTPKTK